MLRWILFGLVGLLAAIVTAVATAPARFVDLALDQATHGRVRLAESAGTVWRGSARLVIVDVDDSSGGQRLSSAGLAVPGRIGWAVRAWPLLAGLVDATISIDGMAQPVNLQGSFTELRIGAGAIALPSVELSRLGSPWNSIRPSGALAVNWDALAIRNGRLSGRATLELRNAASALTPVAPLGSYRVNLDGTGTTTKLSIETLSGPLRLSGDGSWDPDKGLRFLAQASAEPAEAARLQSFLGLLGRREGEHTILRIGA